MQIMHSKPFTFSIKSSLIVPKIIKPKHYDCAHKCFGPIDTLFIDNVSVKNAYKAKNTSEVP